MRNSIYQSAVALMSIALLVLGRITSYPDNVYMSHGLPLAWGVHQLVTIVGPVDIWRVNLVNLTIDLVFWLGLVIIIPWMWKALNREPSL